jgi:cyclohexyl-isocyanide hydratase
MTETTSDDPGRTVHFGVLLFEGCDDLDVIGPANVLFALESARRFAEPFAPIQVHLVAETAGPVTSGHGVVLTPTTTYAECPRLDVLVVAGGSGGPDNKRQGRLREYQHEPTLAFIRSVAARPDTIVASVCTGSFVLAGAGVLAGRRANTHWLQRDELVALMAERGEPFELVPERVVDDGDIITCGGVSSGIDLGLRLVERTFGPKVRALVALGVERETPASRDDALQTAGV